MPLRGLSVRGGEVDLPVWLVVIEGSRHKLGFVAVGHTGKNRQRIQLLHHRGLDCQFDIGDVGEATARDQLEAIDRDVAPEQDCAGNLGPDGGGRVVATQPIASHASPVFARRDGQCIAGRQRIHAFLQGAEGPIPGRSEMGVVAVSRDEVFGRGGITQSQNSCKAGSHPSSHNAPPLVQGS